MLGHRLLMRIQVTEFTVSLFAASFFFLLDSLQGLQAGNLPWATRWAVKMSLARRVTAGLRSARIAAAKTRSGASSMPIATMGAGALGGCFGGCFGGLRPRAARQPR